MIIPIVIALLIIAAVIWYRHYQREEFWNDLGYRCHKSILVNKSSNMTGKRILYVTDDEIRIQHVGRFSKSYFLNHIVFDGDLVYLKLD